MELPEVKWFGRGDPVYVRAQQVWLVLVGMIMNSDRKPKRPFVITYGDLAEAMGMDRRAGITLPNALGIVGQYCAANDLPTLNSVVVNQETMVPGDHVVTRKAKSWQQEQAEAMKTDWNQIRVPTTGAFRRVAHNT
ncbi:MAG: hypothetical protein ACTHLT_00195 [Devosia sp.]